MMETWLLMRTGPGVPAMNMALDEALLESSWRLGRPVLRFYSWTEPAATFGYSQRYSDACTWTLLRPLIRRPTGGGLVPHVNDWTYSLIFPPGHYWFNLSAVESYCNLHQWIHLSFSALAISTQLATLPEKPAPGRCFIGAEKFDLLKDGVKIAGAAQRRNRQGLLIQGSIQPQGYEDFRSRWENAMCASGPPSVSVSWEPHPLEGALKERAEQLGTEKYSQPWYNERR